MLESIAWLILRKLFFLNFKKIILIRKDHKPEPAVGLCRCMVVIALHLKF